MYTEVGETEVIVGADIASGIEITDAKAAQMATINTLTLEVVHSLSRTA